MMMRTLLVLLTLLCLPSAMGAEKEGVLNSLLAPGPLIGGHKQLENNCFECHTVGKGLAMEKCLTCHKDIKQAVDSKKGFHGLATQTCVQCHSDHKGRDFDSVAVNTKAFDHFKMTGYALVGKHAQISCQGCHREKRTGKFLRPNDIRYTAVSVSSCKTCHKKDDVHFFTGKPAKQDCNSCHSTKSWKEGLTFNHDRDTKFKLEQRHAELKCADCHIVNKAQHQGKYEWPKLAQSKCESCHQDVHKNNLSPTFRGGDCLKCHSQQKWKIEKFDHSVTSYPLRGKHVDIKCVDCHKQAPKVSDIKNFNWTGLKSDCLSCHKDVHLFGPAKSKRYGNMNQCLKCHEESSWKKIHDFNHSTTTRFALDGKHTDLKCAACHMPSDKKNPTTMPNPHQGIYEWKKLEEKSCENCHKNPHVGQFKPAVLAKGCTSCHVTSSWRTMKSEASFDHAKTRFPLTEAHSKVSCNDCHLVDGKKVYKFATADQKFCISCHKNVHEKQFSSRFSASACSECHTTKNFTERLPFDHARTSYKLEGEHAKLNCVDCHKPTKDSFKLRPPNMSKKDFAAHRDPKMSHMLFPELAAGKSCTTCHADYHAGQLGTGCATCHTVEGWKKLSFDHAKTSFPLTDKHAKVDCKKCHTQDENKVTSYHGEKRPLIRYKPIPAQCSECHSDPHKGSFGKSCNECHTARGWKVTKDFHRGFTLKGVHYSLSCNECHRENRKLSGLSQDCMFCHQKDDVHHGTLPNCKDCHMQTFWEHNEYKHSMSRFPLRGVHRTLECGDCHYRGGAQAIYQGLDTRCESCHMSDALAQPSHKANPALYLTNCLNCHRNYFTFQKTN